MIICLDVDGVINNLMEVTLEIYNERYHANYKLDDITAHNLNNCFELDVANKMQSIFKEAEIWNKVKPVAGSQEVVKRLIRNGHQIYFVTNNNPHTYGQKFDWIRNYFPFIEESKIVCMSDKWNFRCDIMIEDCYETLIARPYYHRILMNQPWNKNVRDYAYGIYRCNNWEQIENVVNNINEE